MAQLRVSAGVQGMADATAGPTSPQSAGGNGLGRLLPDFSRASTWAWVYFAAALVYVLTMYFGHGGSRGAVL
jgi:hypothetical protein